MRLMAPLLRTGFTGFEVDNAARHGICKQCQMKLPSQTGARTHIC